METLQSNINGTLSAGTENFGLWQSKKGGRLTSSSTTTRDPGARLPRIIPGRLSYENITLTRDYDPVRDGAIKDRLDTLCGTGTVFTLGIQIRDGAQNIIRTETRTGKLLELGPIEGDTNSDTDKATLEVVFGVDG